MSRIDTLLQDRRSRLVLAFGFGVLTAAGFAPVGVALLAGLGLTVLFLLIDRAQSVGEAFWVGLLWASAYFFTGLFWLFRSLHTFGELPAVLAVVALALLSCLLALIPAALAAAARDCPVHSRVRCLLVLPALWVLGEWVRGSALLGFGWLSIGYAFTGNVLSAWAPVLGVYGVSLAVALIAGGLCAALNLGREPRVKAVIAIVFGAIAVGSSALDEYTWSQPSTSLDVRLVQPDLPIVTRAVSERVQELRLDRVQAMSRQTALGDSPDLIVWPESVYLTPLSRLSRQQTQVPVTVARQMQAKVLFNAFDEPGPLRFFNSLWLADESGTTAQAVYGKRHLVPFGEFVPYGFRWFVDWLHIPMADQQSGDRPQSVISIDRMPVAVGICYENLFGQELADWWKVGSPELIINVANLGWFSPSAAAQFRQISAMRAIETARPFLQVLNNSESAWIDAKGRIELQARSGAQNLDMKVRGARGEPTVFVRWGHWPLVALALGLLGLAAGLTFRAGRSARRRGLPD